MSIEPKHESLNDPMIINNHVNGIKSSSDEEFGLFTVKRANKWIEENKGKPIPRMLFNEFWFEGELCILFADTNQGKSILAVQIGESISSGKPIPGFKLETERQPVLYFDFELSAKQFESRYSTKNVEKKVYENHYEWDDNFIRVEINPKIKIPDGKSFEQYLNESLIESIDKTKAKILIIDNLTYLKTDVERSKDAAPFVQKLQSIIDEKSVSILALTHTPKRDLSKPITRNDISGSKRLIDFCDSSFAIGESHKDKSLKYFKQIKARETEHIYDRENVIVCELKKGYNFLAFEFKEFGSEQDHLRHYSENERSDLETKVKGLMENNHEMTAYAIARELCPNEDKFNSFKVTVSRIVKRIKSKENADAN